MYLIFTLTSLTWQRRNHYNSACRQKSLQHIISVTSQHIMLRQTSVCYISSPPDFSCRCNSHGAMSGRFHSSSPSSATKPSDPPSHLGRRQHYAISPHISYGPLQGSRAYRFVTSTNFVAFSRYSASCQTSKLAAMTLRPIHSSKPREIPVVQLNPLLFLFLAPPVFFQRLDSNCLLNELGLGPNGPDLW